MTIGEYAASSILRDKRLSSLLVRQAVAGGTPSNTPTRRTGLCRILSTVDLPIREVIKEAFRFLGTII